MLFYKDIVLFDSSKDIVTEYSMKTGLSNESLASKLTADEKEVKDAYQEMCNGYDSMTSARQLTAEKVIGMLADGEIMMYDVRGPNEYW